MISLWLNERSYTLNELAKGKFEYGSPFEKYTLEFCRDWLNGKTDFEIKTSGSTGAPKPISFTRQQLESSARLTQKALGLKEKDTALVCLDTRYIAGQMMLVRSMTIGMNMLVIEPVANPLKLVPQNSTIDFAAVVPYQLQAILDSPEAIQLNAIRNIIVGGAASSPDLIARLQNYSCSFSATYGMTETISHIALQRLNGKDSSNYFQALPSIALRKDERGCLVIRAPHISNEEIVTNDLVEFVGDHSFRIVGRWDNLINTGGVKISPENTEAKISTVFQLLNLKARFFIHGLADEMLGNKVVLIIEGEPWDSAMLNKLEVELKTAVDRFEFPRAIKFVRQFAETDTKKINRKKTAELIMPNA